ncbi:MAG: flagellar export protein FliJ [Psychrobium sp.]|nr:flagellar export protein FliJ [Psychrobium sp.]
MADIKQLTIVKEMAEKKERDALKMFSAAQQQINKLQNQMQTLSEYRQDYLMQMQPNAEQRVTASRLIALQEFLVKLDVSINQQRDVIARASLVVDSRRTQWASAKRYTDSIAFLIDRQQQELAQIEHKQQQKLADEFSMMAFHRKKRR